MLYEIHKYVEKNVSSLGGTRKNEPSFCHKVKWKPHFTNISNSFFYLKTYIYFINTFSVLLINIFFKVFMLFEKFLQN